MPTASQVAGDGVVDNFLVVSPLREISMQSPAMSKAQRERPPALKKPTVLPFSSKWFSLAVPLNRWCAPHGGQSYVHRLSATACCHRSCACSGHDNPSAHRQVVDPSQDRPKPAGKRTQSASRSVLRTTARKSLTEGNSRKIRHCAPEDNLARHPMSQGSGREYGLHQARACLEPT